MHSRSSVRAVAGTAVLAFCLGASPASALNAISFVSGKGVDAGNNCFSPATPCRSFGYALGQTNAGGEIKTLEPGSYGIFPIRKSITITGVPGASIATPGGARGIVIDAGPAATVTLRGISINGQGLGLGGILVLTAKVVNIVDVAIRGVLADGISVAPTSGSVSVTISNTVSSNNGNFGMQFVPAPGASVKASIVEATTNDNGFAGILVSPGAKVSITLSNANNNGIDGFRAAGDATSVMRLGRSVATGNSTGIDNAGTASVYSFGNNEVSGNTTDFNGVITFVAPQ